MNEKKNCQNGCNKISHCRGFCSTCYGKFYRSNNFNKSDKIDKAILFWSKVNITDNINDCWEWQGYTRDTGYGEAGLGQKVYLAHRVAWFHTYGKLPTEWLLHSCDNPPCCNPNHLREGTHRDNMQDAVIRERFPLGERHWKTKLTQEEAEEIKFNTDLKGTELAAKYNVHKNTVYAIKQGRNWRTI